MVGLVRRCRHTPETYVHLCPNHLTSHCHQSGASKCYYVYNTRESLENSTFLKLVAKEYVQVVDANR